MAVLALINARVEIGGIDMSTFATSVELPIQAEDLETTNFASGGWRARIAGLREGEATIAFNQDYATTTVDDRLWSWLGTVQTLKVRPTSAAISATNPEYQCSVLVTEYTPVNGAVGDLAVVEVTWPISGVVTRATS